MALKLYCFGESGHSYKAALALQLSGLDWEPVYVDFFNGQTRDPDWRAEVNEMGESPVLDTGSRKISQSGVIQMEVSERSGKFGGTTPEETQEILRWILWDNAKLSTVAGPARFLSCLVPEDKRPDAAVIDWLKNRVLASYDILNRHLDGRDWIVGDGLTNADLTCCGYLFYDEEFGFDRKAWPHIDAWLDRIAAMPGWKHPYDLMPPAHPMNQKGAA
ncbi:MAG: glutathione S-transferase family protein [Mangrovicoccus sp.]